MTSGILSGIPTSEVVVVKFYEFEAVIHQHSGMDTGYIQFPYETEAEFGTKGQVKVKAQFDGHPYRGSLAPMGDGSHILILTKAVRKAIGKSAGNTVLVRIEQDLEPRMVVLPEDLKALLDSNPQEKTFFDSLAYTHRKEYALWIGSAKRAVTRNNRLQKTLALLKNGTKHP
jgi:hypothetical protein